MRCHDCGAPCGPSTVVCPFCASGVGLHRVSERQRLILQWLMPLLRCLVLAFLAFLIFGTYPYNWGFCGLVGNIGG